MKEASEQSTPKSEAENMNLDDFSNLSLVEMEKKLTTPVEAKDQSNQNSEASEEVSVTEETAEQADNQDNEEASEGEETSETEENSDTEESSESTLNTDKQKDKKAIDFEKSYKELLPEYTRSRQELKALNDRLAALESKGQTKEAESTTRTEEVKSKKLAQLKEKSPETAEFIQELVNELVEEQVGQKIKPIEESVSLTMKQKNVDAFSQATEEFRKSPLSSLEPQLVAIINENPAWQERILNDPNAFKDLHKELVTRHLDDVVKLKSKSLRKGKIEQKQRDIENADVGVKPNKSGGVKPTDEMSEEEFGKLSLKEMEARLPKAKR